MNEEDLNKLRELEESLWIAETRFDRGYMDRILAPDFFEFGRSGRIYMREDTLSAPPQKINAVLPLKDFKVHMISDGVVLVTYTGEVVSGNLLTSNRSSLWLKTPGGWQLRFHQGTPVTQ